MPVIVKQLAGILNTDDDNENIPPSHHKDARNILFRGSPGNMRAEICKGNRKITNTLPAYDNQCIGAFYDEVKQRVFYFNYNSYNFHGIYIYDVIADTVSRLLVSFTDSQEDIFEFDPDYPIASVNILYRTEEDGDVLLWTDRTNRPKCINIKDALARHYGTNWEPSYLTVAKPMPLIPPTCEYKDDSTVNINNLRKKLYQFRYRWVYRNLEKSTWSPWSKLFAPLSPDDVATDINPQKNNAIDVTLDTGDSDIVKIEIAARQTLATAYSDPFLVKVLDKEDGGVYNNVQYTFRFYNDSSYPYIDVTESNLLFDYVPKKANTQELLNGNVIIYGGITEGYNFDETLNTTLTVGTIAYSGSSGSVRITKVVEDHRVSSTFPNDTSYAGQLDLTGTPATGDVYTININDGVTTHAVSYTVLGGDTLTDVANGLAGAVAAAVIQPPDASAPMGATVFSTSHIYIFDGVVYTYTSGTGTSIFLLIEGNSNMGIVGVTSINYNYAPGSSTPVDGVSNSIYKHKSKYAFGLVYFDEFGVTNGVVSTDAFLIETPELTTIGDTPSDIPKITVSISHQPPTWAKTFSFVRSANLTFSNLLSTVTSDTLKDSEYGYMNITNHQENTDGLTAYSFSAGDRVRIIGEYGDSAVISPCDFPILDLVEDPTVSGVAQTGSWLKVPYNAVLAEFGTADNYLIEIYTPAPNAAADQLVYYEFGESYDVLNPGTATRYHDGMIQAQTALLPATFQFTRGDFYIKERKIPFDADLTNVNETWIVDQSVSDFFPSRVVGNGRQFVEDPYAGEKYYSTLIRYSLEYQQNTSINQTNRFYPENFSEVDRSRGDIQRFKLRGQDLRVFQSVGVGVIPVYQQIMSTASGSNEILRSDELINQIRYYVGNYGMGNEFCGLASGSSQDYFTDPIHGYQLRVSRDGITPINELYKGQYYISSLITPYAKEWSRPDGSKAKILACYDTLEEEFVTSLQGGVRSVGSVSNYTFTFNEKRNAYASFYDYFPDWMICAADKIISWKDGEIWVHDVESAGGYAKFYDTEYYPLLTLVFSEPELVRKTFLTIGYQSNQYWQSRTTGDINTSMINPQTGFQQQSQLKDVDYQLTENLRVAAFLRDANSLVNPKFGILWGDVLQGQWLEAKLRYLGNDNGWIYGVFVKYSQSNKFF